MTDLSALPAGNREPTQGLSGSRNLRGWPLPDLDAIGDLTRPNTINVGAGGLSLGVADAYKIGGLPVGSAAPNSGDVLKFVAGSWSASAPSVEGSSTAFYRKSANQTLTSGAFNLLSFDNQFYDGLSKGAVTTGASWRYTASADVFITILSHVLTTLGSYTVSTSLFGYVFKNGSALLWSGVDFGNGGVNTHMSMTIAAGVQLAAGDYVDLRIVPNASIAIWADSHTHLIENSQ